MESNEYSVLLSVYEKEKPNYLREAIDSMINQTIIPDEIIVVEDGILTDDLYRVLDNYGNRIKRIKNDNNMGLGFSLNKGLMFCRNELVARMDTDDISKCDRCEKQLDLFRKNKNLSIVGTWVDEFIDNPNNIVSSRRVPIDYKSIYEYSKRRSGFNHPSVMFKKVKCLKMVVIVTLEEIKILICLAECCSTGV